MPTRPNITNAIQNRYPNAFFNTTALLGGPSVNILAGASFSTPALDVSGFNTIFVVWDLTLAAGGLNALFLDTLDPETQAVVVGQGLQIGAFGGPAAAVTEQAAYNLVTFSIAAGATTGVPLWLSVLRWTSAVQTSTVANARCWLCNT